MNTLFTRFRNVLRTIIQKPVTIVFNRNNSTFVTVQFQTPLVASLHEAFLEAPEPIVHSLAAYMNGKKQEEEKLYSYMMHYLRTTGRKKVDAKPSGTTYDLAHLFHSINQAHFKNKLSVTTTWWAKKRKAIRSCALGVFIDTLQLIKIDSLLDSPRVPQYVVETILHHEMLHAMIPPKKATNGHLLVHTPEFRKRELVFPHFQQTKTWLRDHSSFFFHRSAYDNGRT